jgi:hypothetical protein
MIMARSTPDPDSVNIHDLNEPEDVLQEAAAGRGSCRQLARVIEVLAVSSRRLPFRW